MLRRVTARAPLPTSVPVGPAAKLSAARTKRLAANGLRAQFLSAAEARAQKSDLPLGFTGRTGEVGLGPRDSQALYAGLGERGPATSVRDYRLAVTAAVRRAQEVGSSGLTLQLPASDVMTVADIFHPARPLTKEEVVEKTACFGVTAAYKYDRLKTTSAEGASKDGASASKTKGKKGKRQPAAAAAAAAVDPFELVIVSAHTHAIRTGGIIGQCVNDARNLGNLREDEGVPAFYVEWARRHMLPEGIKLRTVLRGAQIEKAGMNLLYNVGKGSVHEPYVMILEYVGNRRNAHSTALVGKGVTFDCGGLNVKPYGSMETMHTDMMGAATALSTLKAVATLKLPVNVVAAVGLVENSIGPDAYFPSSILTSLKGLTVEVLNTDAEGRLVLADMLTYVQKHAHTLEKTPSTIIDLATLTGAIIVSLGTRRAGLFSNSSRLSEKLMATGTRSGEELWPMPIGEEHQEAMKGGIADLTNAAKGRAAGSCTAAAFLSNFIEKGVEWAHMDIAGTADTGDKPKGFEPAGVSGYGVQLLVDYLRK